MKKQKGSTDWVLMVYLVCVFGGVFVYHAYEQHQVTQRYVACIEAYKAGMKVVCQQP